MPHIGRKTLALMAAGMAGSAGIRAFDSALPLLASDFGVTPGQTGCRSAPETDPDLWRDMMVRPGS
jgi:hypothetical protein